MKDSLKWLLHRMIRLLRICIAIPHWLYTSSLGEKYTSVTKMKYLVSPQNWGTQLIFTNRNQKNMCELWSTWVLVRQGKFLDMGTYVTQSLMTWQGYLEPVLEATRHDSSKPGHDKGNKIELPWQSTAEGTSGPQNLRILK